MLYKLQPSKWRNFNSVASMKKIIRITQYVKPHQKRVTPIHFASAYGYAQVVETLINHGADVNAQTHSLETPLHLAARRAHFDVVKMLLHHGANPNKTTKKGHSPLHYSVTATSTYDDIDETSVTPRGSTFFEDIVISRPKHEISKIRVVIKTSS